MSQSFHWKTYQAVELLFAFCGLVRSKDSVEGRALIRVKAMRLVDLRWLADRQTDMLLLEQSGPTACFAKYDSGVMRGEKGGRKKRQRVEARKKRNYDSVKSKSMSQTGRKYGRGGL
jgi:hypothetical protein